MLPPNTTCEQAESENRDFCDHEEKILRAIVQEWWDASKNRYHTDVFAQKNLSVSRLKISSMDELVEHFYRDIHKPPRRILFKAFEFEIGAFKKESSTYMENNKSIKKKKDFKVFVDPLENNPAHALVCPNISEGLANYLLKNLSIIEHVLPLPELAAGNESIQNSNHKVPLIDEEIPTRKSLWSRLILRLLLFFRLRS
jgi:hypothetical protein